MADEDCPELASLTRFWVATSEVVTESNEEKKQAELRARMDPTTAPDVLFASSSSSSSATIGADRTQSILQNLSGTPAEANAGLAVLSKTVH